MAGRTLTVYLAGDGSDFRRDMNRNERSMQSMGGRVRGLGNTLKGMLGPALAGAGIAVAAVAGKMAVDGVNAAIEDRAAQEQLATTLERVGLAHDVGPIEDWIDAQARATKFTDDELRPAFGKLADKVKDTEAAQTLLNIAMGISEEKGKPLETVVSALNKAMDGSLGPLKKLAPGIDLVGLSAEGTEGMVAALDDRFGTMAQDMATTDKGKIEEVGQAFGELQEAFGEGFLTSMDGAGDGAGDLADTIYELRDEAEKLGESLGDLLQDVVPVVTGLTDAKDQASLLIGVIRDSGDFGAGFIEGIKKVTNPIQNLLDTARAAKEILMDLGAMDRTVSSLTYTGPDGTPGNRPSPNAVENAAGQRSITVNNVKIEAGVGDPVAIARAVNRVIAQGAARSGGGR